MMHFDLPRDRDDICEINGCLSWRAQRSILVRAARETCRGWSPEPGGGLRVTVVTRQADVVRMYAAPRAFVVA
jgi:hypothetical protein